MYIISSEFPLVSGASGASGTSVTSGTSNQASTDVLEVFLKSVASDANCQEIESEEKEFKTDQSLIDKLLAQGYTKNKIKMTRENPSLIKDGTNKLKEKFKKESKEEKTDDIDVKTKKKFRAHTAQQCLVFIELWRKWNKIHERIIRLFNTISPRFSR